MNKRKKTKKVVDFQVYLAEKLKNPKFRKYYDEYGNKDHGFEFKVSYSNILKIIDKFSNVIFVNSEATRKHIQNVIHSNKIIKTY